MTPGELIHWIDERLTARFGVVPAERPDPVETLVLTILSQNTNDTNRDRAYASLLETFGTLQAVQEQPVDAVAEAIRAGGLHQQKSKAILHALNQITKTQGALDLSFLEDLSLNRSLEWLLSLPGVGKKTAGIVLLFSFDRPYFPVDTHIRRIVTRIGLFNGRGDPHDAMNRLLPLDPSLMRRLHLHLIEHGRSVCKARNPQCRFCDLSTVCAFVTTQQGTRKGES